MSKGIEERPKTERHVHVRSKSSTGAVCFDNRCRHQICTCYKPSHKCPIDYNKQGYIPPSHYQAEYVKHSPMHVEAIRPIDNLKNGKEFFDGTIYQREYKPKKTQSELAHENAKNQELNKILRGQNYNNDHLKYTTSLPTADGIDGTYAERNLAQNYPKPAKFVIPKAEKLDNKLLQKETEYGREYKPLKRDYSGNLRINYDNLTTYNGPTKPAITTYQAEHYGRDGGRYGGRDGGRDGGKVANGNYGGGQYRDDPAKVANDHLAELNKRNNQLTYAQFLPKDNYGKSTEYTRNYEGKTQAYHDCPINEMPSMTDSQKRMPAHMYYDCQSAKWRKERV